MSFHQMINFNKLCAAFLILIGALLFPSATSKAAQNDGGISQDRPGTYTVVLRDEAPYFNPKRLRVPRGSTIIWDNRGPALIHTVLVNTVKGVSRSGSIRPGQAWSFVLAHSDDAVIKTTCEIHPYMYGIVIVGQPPDSLISAVEAATDSSKGTGESARILEFPLPVADSVPGILAIDPDDNVWFTMGGGFANIDLPPLNMVGRLTLDGDLRVFTLPSKASGPSGLVIAPDGIIYVTELFGNNIARLDPNRRTIEEHPIPTANSWPTGLALDDEGNLWFNQTRGNKLARLSKSGVVTEFYIPTANSRSTGMVIDQQGNIWIAERDASKIGCLRRDGTFIEYSIPTPKASPTGMAVDRQGRIWFAERQGNKIGVVENGRIREYPLPNPHSGPFFVMIDADGLVWFTQLFGNRIGVLNPETGKITEYDLPTKDSWPGALAMDSQGNVWFTMQLRNKVGVILRSPSKETKAHSSEGARH